MSRTELLKKIKKIEIASSILANELFTGNYRSYFKGNGMEFSDIRRYSPGDDVKNIAPTLSPFLIALKAKLPANWDIKSFLAKKLLELEISIIR